MHKSQKESRTGKTLYLTEFHKKFQYNLTKNANGKLIKIVSLSQSS